MARSTAGAEEEEEEEFGKHFGKRDLYRVGFFDDAPPGPFDEYSGPPKAGARTLRKGPQMTCSLRPGCFEKEFKRVFVGEALPEPDEEGKKQKELGIIMPPGGTKWHSTPGDSYGCFGKQPKSFSPETKPELELAAPEAEERKPNMKIKPPAFGGPGYVDICINPYLPMYKGREPYEPEFERVQPAFLQMHRRDFVSQCKPLEYFNENPYRQIVFASRDKKPGDEKKKKKRRGVAPAAPKFNLYFPPAPLGQFNGCFAPFPRYMPNPPSYEKKKKRGKHKIEPIRPIGGPPVRTKYTASIIDLVTRIACNSNNYKDYREQVYPLR